MNSLLGPEHRGRVRAFQRKHHTGVVTLLFTDFIDSTRLKQELGDSIAVTLLDEHQETVREILREFAEAEEISTAGDSFFLVFVRPSDAVRFSLLLQARLRKLTRRTGHPISDRIGIHVGEVIIEEGEGSGKDLYGIQVDACARINALSQSGQILMSRFAFDNARQVLKGQAIQGIGPLAWLNHGPYVFKGITDPLEICEVGETGIAPLAPPSDSEKARRCMPVEGELILGWRPALGQEVPNTKWFLERKLGEGGFGEVWLGCHETLKERRVFKFCFRADRVRSLKREVTLFRLLKERVGPHANMVGIQEVNFDVPPYYIVMDYAQGTDLATWCREHQGAENVPLPARLDIVAQIADALEAAHSVGILHRDVKPSNILVNEGRQSSALQGTATARLTDFGIGQVVSQEALGDLTRLGFTKTLGWTDSPRTGTYLYMAPELLAGKPASIQSDIYSLGVVLLQLVTGDLGRPVTTDWAAQVSDPLIREDLARCFAGNPQQRFAHAGELARSIRELPQRRLAFERRDQAAAEERMAGFKRPAQVLAVGIILLLCLLRCIGFGPLERVECSTFDMRVREALRFRPPAALNLGFVFIDDQSINEVAHGSLGYRFGLYWPRQVYGRLLQELSTQGAKAIALDVLFGESRPDHPLVRLSDGRFMESDEFFALQMRSASNVIVAVPKDLPLPALFMTNATAKGAVTLDKDLDGVLRRVQVFRTCTNWHPAFYQIEKELSLRLDQARVESHEIVIPRGESAQGPITIPLDNDGNFDLADFVGEKLPPGTIRKQKPFAREIVWQMGVVLAAQELGLDLAKAEIDLGYGRVKLRSRGGAERVIPVDASGYAYVDWSLPANDRQLTREPVHSVLAQARWRSEGLAGEITNRWKGKLVVVGSSTAELVGTFGATPLRPNDLLVSAHWNVANGIITNRFIRRFPLALELGLILILGATAAGVSLRVRPLIGTPILFFMALVYVALAVAVYVHSRYWLPLGAPVLGVVAISMCLLFWRFRVRA